MLLKCCFCQCELMVTPHLSCDFLTPAIIPQDASQESHPYLHVPLCGQYTQPNQKASRPPSD